MRKRWSIGLALLLAAPVAAQDSLPSPAQPSAGQPAAGQRATGQGAAGQAAGGRAQAGGQAAQNYNFQQNVSYAIGLSIGRDLRSNGVPVDLQQLATGIRDSLVDAQPRLNEQQIAQVMAQFQQQMQQKAEEQMAQMAPQAAENKKRGEAFLAQNAKEPGVTVTDSGLQYRVLKEGSGPSPKATSTVRVNYEGRTIDGEVFDASANHGGPAQFPLNRVIPGWTQAVQLMQVGAEYEVYVPSELAYGQTGSPPKIGPNETLIFKIELLDVVQ